MGLKSFGSKISGKLGMSRKGKSLKKQEKPKKLEKLKKPEKSKKLEKLKKPRGDLKLMDEIFKGLHEKDSAKDQRFAILGIGNDLKGDDAVGWYVVDRLRAEFGKDANLLLVKTSVPENHVREISEFAPKLLIVVDAADFGKRPGNIKIIKEYQITHSFISTHNTPLTIFLRLYNADEPYRKPVTLIGIQRESNEFGQLMGSAAKKAGNEVAKLIAMLYRKNYLDKSIEREIGYISSPLKRITDRFRRKKK